MKDRYLYMDKDVLINKLNIKNNEELEIAEADITYIKLLELDKTYKSEGIKSNTFAFVL